MSTRSPRARLAAAVAPALALALAAGACGSSAAHTSSSATTAPPDRPARIVSLSPTATEMLYAIGAGPQVKAVDDQSDYPPNAPRTKLSGMEPNVEAIANEQPDLVVVADNTAVPQLKKLGINVLVEPAATTLADTYAQIDQLGRATGRAPEARALVAHMQQQIAAIRAAAGTPPKPLTYYYELDNTYYTATSKTFIGALLSLIGLRNIADAADKQGSGYPQLSSEYIVARNPDLVLLADTKCCHQNEQTVAARPGWNSLNAVRMHDVVLLDDDIASRWGPRVVDLLRQVASATQPAMAAP